MQVTLKLFASLAPFMPEGAKDNAVEIEIEEGTTINQIFDRYAVPHKMAHLVLVNGIYIAPGDRATRTLNPGDALAAWPPVAGG
jgi:molybdopterin converting factor small subunit